MRSLRLFGYFVQCFCDSLFDSEFFRNYASEHIRLVLSGKRHKAVRKLPSMSAFSPEERARMPLLCDADGVLAVPFGPVRDGAGKAPDKTLFLFFN